MMGGMLIVWVGLLALIAWGVKAFIDRDGAGGPRGNNGGGSALEVLRERYARGEIDGKEFEERRRALSR